MAAGALTESEQRAVALGFDLNAPPAGFLAEPFAVLAMLRRHAPVHRMPDGSWFLTRYDDVLACYRDKRMLSDKHAAFGPKFGVGSPLFRHHTTSLVFNDPPLHTRVRRLLAAAFTPRNLAAMQPRIDVLVQGLCDGAEARGRLDLIADFAFALPVEVVCDMLGVPKGDRGSLRRWATTILSALEPVTPPALLADGNACVEEFCAYLRGLMDERRRRPGEDVISVLLAGEAGGEKLTEEELLQNCIFLLNAGHETTTNLIGNGVAALLENPDQLARLRDDPSLIRSAVEEFLRYESSNQIGNRTVAEDMELGGVQLAAGDYITMSIQGANRDPAQFPEPDRLDVGREPNRHLAFGGGPHICLGNTLARMEGATAILQLVTRVPELRRDGDFTRGGRARFRGYASYPIAVD